MPTENTYSLQDLADLTGVTPRTVRYYIAQGLLPAPEGAGPGARYSEGHLARLRLIRQLQNQHLPLAEIRARLTGLDDDAIANLAASEPRAAVSVPESAVDYIRALLAPPAPAPMRRLMSKGPLQPPAYPTVLALASQPGPPPPEPTIERSQWDRIALTPDIELHIRRPLSRGQNKRVDRLITIARQLLEEEPQ